MAKFDGLNVMLACSCMLLGMVEVVAPVALVPAAAAATLFARQRRDFFSAAAVTALLAARGSQPCRWMQAPAH